MSRNIIYDCGIKFKKSFSQYFGTHFIHKVALGGRIKRSYQLDKDFLLKEGDGSPQATAKTLISEYEAKLLEAALKDATKKDTSNKKGGAAAAAAAAAQGKNKGMEGRLGGRDGEESDTDEDGLGHVITSNALKKGVISTSTDVTGGSMVPYANVFKAMPVKVRK